MAFEKISVRVGSSVYTIRSDEFATVTICNGAISITHKRRNQKCKHFWFTPPSNTVRNSISDTRKQNPISAPKNLPKIFESVLDSKIQKALQQEESSNQGSLKAQENSGPVTASQDLSHQKIIPSVTTDMIDEQTKEKATGQEIRSDTLFKQGEDLKNCQKNQVALLDIGTPSNSTGKKPEKEEVSPQESAGSSPQENLPSSSQDCINVVSQSSSSTGTRKKGMKVPMKQEEPVPQFGLWIMFDGLKNKGRF